MTPESMTKDSIIKMSENIESQRDSRLSLGNIMSLHPIKMGIKQLPNPPIRMGIIIKKIISSP